MSLNPEQMDVLAEMVNIGVGHGAAVLNTMLTSHIKLWTPSIKLLKVVELANELESLGGKDLSVVRLGFRGVISGEADLAFPAKEASALVTALTGERPADDEIDALRAGTFCEVGNVVLNSVMGTISNMLELDFVYSVPYYSEGGCTHLLDNPSLMREEVVLYARTCFLIEEFRTEGNIVIFLYLGSFERLVTEVNQHICKQTEPHDQNV